MKILGQIDDQAFNGELLESLVELDLGDNNLGQIPQSGVPRLQNLRYFINFFKKRFFLGSCI